MIVAFRAGTMVAGLATGLGAVLLFGAPPTVGIVLIVAAACPTLFGRAGDQG